MGFCAGSTVVHHLFGIYARPFLEVKTNRVKRYIGLFYKGFPLFPVSYLMQSALAYRKTFISQIAPLHLYTV